VPTAPCPTNTRARPPRFQVASRALSVRGLCKTRGVGGVIKKNRSRVRWNR
jgi:hypothetical protein